MGNIITPVYNWGKWGSGCCCQVEFLIGHWPGPQPFRLLSHLPGGQTCIAILTGVSNCVLPANLVLVVTRITGGTDDELIVGTSSPATRGLRQPNWWLEVPNCSLRYQVQPWDSALLRKCFLTESDGSCSATDSGWPGQDTFLSRTQLPCLPGGP